MAAAGRQHSLAAAGHVIAGALRRRRRPLVGSLLGSAGYSIAMLVGPFLGKAAVDDVIASRRASLLPLYIGGLIAAGLVRGACGGMRKYFATLMGAGVSNDLRSRMYDHLQRLSFSFHDMVGVGELMSRASYDATTIEGALMNIPFMSQTIVLAVGGAVLMFLLQPALALLVMVIVVVGAVPPLLLSLPMNRLALSVQDAVGVLTQFIEQSINGIRVIKGHGLEGVKETQARSMIDGLFLAATDLVRRRALFVTAFLGVPATAIMATVALGGWLGLRGAMTPGNLFAFLSYLGVLVAIVPVVVQAFSVWPQALASATRIHEVLVAQPDVTTPAVAAPLARAGGGVRLEGVTFGYVPGAPVLEGIDLEVAAGDSLALVGTSGSGKSTIAKLVPRFYDPWAGRVLLDGVDVRALDLRELRGAVAIVFEETVTFSSSIAENIALGRPSATREEVEAAARLAHADEFIRRLPDGYDTVLGEQGFTLSGGQRQRIAIARAVLRDPLVLILDDATSALDPAGQARVTEAVREFMRGRTALVIAHRPETIALANEVALVDGGRVVARGAHRDLLDLPLYRRALGLEPAPGAVVARPGA